MVGGPEPEEARAVEAFGGAADIEPERFQAQWLRLFNTATLPFYWGRYEPVRGRPDEARLRLAADWLVARGVTVKGHPLVWHTVQPGWLLGLSSAEVEALLRERVRTLVGGFAGTIDLWDAINEAVIMPVFANGDERDHPARRQKGLVGMIRLAVEEARAANPDARLVVNDFDLSAAYERLLGELLEAGVRIDAIGLQTHMHKGYRARTRSSSTGRPVRPFRAADPDDRSRPSSPADLMPKEIVDLNDYRIPSWPSTPEGEARQAEEVERHYRSVFGHPAVESLTYWGLMDAGSWLGAPVGFVRADGSEKPSYAVPRLPDQRRVALRAPRDCGRTAPGRVSVRGPRGTYSVAANGLREPASRSGRGSRRCGWRSVDSRCRPS